MKKEVGLAITVGFVLGLVITFGIWTANNSLKRLSPLPTPSPTSFPQPTVQAQTTPAAQPDSDLKLEISSPGDNLLTSTSPLTLTGQSSPSAVITILDENSQQIVTADASGKFSVEVTLEGGYNRLTVTAFDATGKSTSKTLTVTYTTAKI